MKIFKYFLFLTFLLSVAGMCFALSYSLIKYDGHYYMMQKENITFKDSYVNTSEWSFSDYFNHPEISGFLIKKKIMKASEDTNNMLKSWSDQVKKEWKKAEEEIKDRKNN